MVSQIPRLSSYHTSDSLSLEEQTTTSLTETNLVVQNLSKTIVSQQTQIDVLKCELLEYKSLVNDKSLANETSQKTQTDFHSNTVDTSVCDDHQDIQLTKDSFPNAWMSFRKTQTNFTT